MTEYVMLECNRLRGRENYNQIAEDEDEYKNRWVNNVSSYGIVINKGDIISVDTSCINTQGTIQDTIEILGENNEAGYLDNKVGFNFSYYINHTGFNTIPLPFIDMKTYIGYGTKDYTNVNKAFNRGLGEVDFSDYPTNQNVEYNNQSQMPDNFTIIPLEATDGGSGFSENEIYYSSGASSYKILAQQVTAGVLISYSLVEVPITTTNSKVTVVIDRGQGIANPTNPASIDILMPDLSKCSTKKLIRPDGSRYFPASKFWSGCALTNTYVPSDSGNLDPSKLSPNYSPRQKQADIEIPAGLNTPSNIGSIMTSQLQRPKRVDIKGNEPEYCDLTHYQHPVIETNTTLTSTCNFSKVTSPYETTNTLTTTRQLFYSNIALKDPEKWEGLQFSRQFEYYADNNDTRNELNSGSSQIASRGDFGTQTVGNIGLNMCITRTFRNSNELIDMQKGDLILTNIYATEETITKIAKGFRIAETYYGDRSITLTPNSSTYLDGLAAVLDLGLYVDEVSSATLGTNNNAIVSGQRFRFMSGNEASLKSPTDPIYKVVDFGNQTQGQCVGSQPYHYPESETNNDGQQLSHLIVKSRYTTQYNGAELLSHLKLASAGLMRVASTYTETQLFNGANSSTLIALAKSLDVAIVPVYLDNTEPEFYKFGGRPYIAFVAHQTTNTDRTLEYNSITNENWSIDTRNMPYGIQLGLDCSFIRNDAVAMINTNFNVDVKQQQAGLRLNSFDATQNSLPAGIPASFQKIRCQFVNLYGFIQEKVFINEQLIPYTPTTVNITNFNVEYLPQAPYPVPEFIVDLGFEGAKLILSNINTTSLSGTHINNFTPFINLGGYETQFFFDSNLSRFNMSDLNTPTRIGNGQPYESPNLREFLGLISSTPEQQVVNYALTNSCFTFNQFIPSGLTINNSPEFAFSMKQSQTKLIDSQTGLCLYSLILESQNGIKQTQNYTNSITMSLIGTLLGKMGFDIQQFFSSIGSIQTKFNDYPTFKVFNNNYIDYLDKYTRPLTTSAIFSSSEYQALQTSDGNEPLYLLGGADQKRSRPQVLQGSLTAFNLPTQLDYPYLCVYSSITQGGTNTVYHGGIDSKSKIPCVQIITRYNNAGSFFYGVGNSFNFTASKDFSLTDIETDIRLPDGSRPRLLPHSSVIYRIEKPLKQILPQ